VREMGWYVLFLVSVSLFGCLLGDEGGGCVQDANWGVRKRCPACKRWVEKTEGCNHIL
jgi:hypothetical protein